MSASQLGIDDTTPMGATVIDAGVTFRVWAPRAHTVHVVIDTAAARNPGWTPPDDGLLVRRADGTWAGTVLMAEDGTAYRFWMVGDEGSGFKRDPYARELGRDPAFPHCDCIVRRAGAYAWRSDSFRTPEFRDLVLYQLHVGTYWAVDANGADVRTLRHGRVLDLLGRLEHLHELGVNAVQLLPVQEYPTEFSMGYNGTDFFSPEIDYLAAPEALGQYVETANNLMAKQGARATDVDELRSGPNQLKLFVDLCHLYGIAVLFDVVYNHAGGDFGDESLYFFDRARRTSNAESLYFSENGWAGGLVFEYQSANVRQFLIDNALELLREYRLDGLRYDEVSVADRFGGWRFCQDLTATVRYARPSAIQVAEFWNDARWLAVTPSPPGMGFDAAWTNRLMIATRDALLQSSYGRLAEVQMGAIADALSPPPLFPDAWRAVQYVENHDAVYARSNVVERQPRIPRLSDRSNPRSWWARSRSRVATGLLLTAPGIPLLFMGQEILEDKNWSDDPQSMPDSLIWWAGLATDRTMSDHYAFTRDLVHLRQSHPALRGESINVFHARNDTRVLAFHRWLPGEGADVVIVASLSDVAYQGYRLGLPHSGAWQELFNSDYYDPFPNIHCAGNGGRVWANEFGADGFQWCADLVIPANSLLVLKR